MGDVRQVLEFFLSTGLLPALLVGLLLAVAATALALRRAWLDGPAWLAFAAVLCVVGVLVFTLLREGVLLAQEVASGQPLSPPGWQGLRDWSPDGWWRAAADPLGSTQILLNGVLFVPAGVAWTWVTGRPWRVVVALGGLSVAIEVVQGVAGLGANDVADVVANVCGAAIGAAAAVVVVWLTDAAGGRTVEACAWVRRGAAVAAVGAVAVLLPGAGATQRQRVVTAEAQLQFAGTSFSDIERWDRDGTLERRVWRDVLSVDADGFATSQGAAAVRYPTAFLGDHRCVLVRWDDAGMRVEPGAAEVCERPSL